jgi:hypothetical protein
LSNLRERLSTDPGGRGLDTMEETNRRNELDATSITMPDAKVYRKIATVLAVQMDEPFVVTTLEGDIHGKAGDWLAEANTDRAERWVIDDAIFAETYAIDDC